MIERKAKTKTLRKFGECPICQLVRKQTPIICTNVYYITINIFNFCVLNLKILCRAVITNNSCSRLTEMEWEMRRGNGKWEGKGKGSLTLYFISATLTISSCASLG